MPDAIIITIKAIIKYGINGILSPRFSRPDIYKGSKVNVPIQEAKTKDNKAVTVPKPEFNIRR